MVVSEFLFWLTIKIIIVILTTNTFILQMLKRKCVNRKPGKGGSGEWCLIGFTVHGIFFITELFGNNYETTMNGLIIVKP